MGKKRNIFLETNGCLRRALDTSKLQTYFRLNDCRIVSDPNIADYIIFVTCSFKKREEETCYQKIHNLKRYKAKLIVAGCLPAIAPAEFRKHHDGEFLTTKNINEIDIFFSDFRIKFSQIPDANFLPCIDPIPLISKTFIPKINFLKTHARFMKKINLIKRFADKKTREAILRISYGCIECCTYCSIRNAIGPLQSKPLTVCLEEYTRLLKNGYKKFQIMADNVGAYGLDNNHSFSELLNLLSRASKNISVSWNIEQLHPRWIIAYYDNLLEKIKEGKITNILSSIQSGSNRILQLMNRHHTIEEISKILLIFRKANPRLTLRTEVIIGFPSETEEDFLATMQIIKLLRFNHVALFPYYDGYETIASSINQKISSVIISQRLGAAIDFLRKENISYFCNDIDYPLHYKYCQEPNLLAVPRK